MTAAELQEYILTTFPGVQTEEGMGYNFFYTSDDHTIPFATIGTGDLVDEISELSREGVYRLNLGIRKSSYERLFATHEASYDYTQLDRIMPHPEYAQMWYVCVLNPTAETFARVIAPLLAEAFDLQSERMAKRSRGAADA